MGPRNLATGYLVIGAGGMAFTDELLAQRFPLAKARQAHELPEKGGAIGKIVLDVFLRWSGQQHKEKTMDRSHQSHRLVQIGVGLFLAAALLGLAIPHFPAPRLALSAHLVGILQGLFLVVAGLVWPRLSLTRTQFGIAFALVVYQALSATLANVLAAAWAAGHSIIPMAAGAARGSTAQEAVVHMGLRSAGAALIAGLLLMLWGLRRLPVA